MPLVDLPMSSFILFAEIMRETIKVFENVHENPVEGAFEGTFACEVEETKSFKHISKNSPKSTKIHDTRRAHVLRDVK